MVREACLEIMEKGQPEQGYDEYGEPTAKELDGEQSF
jgi:hypothetical protein